MMQATEIISQGPVGPTATSRKITWRWLLPENSSGETGRPVVELVARHDASRKEYWATVERSFHERKDGYTVSKRLLFWDRDGHPTSVVVGRQPVGRYSAKGLESFANEMRAKVDETGELQAMIEIAGNAF